MRWLALLVACSLAGCAGSGGPERAQETQDAETDASPANPVVPVDVDQGEERDRGNGTGGENGAGATPSPLLKLDAEGDAGEWLVVYAPFAEPTDSVEFRYQYDVEAFPEGDGAGALFWPLGLTLEEGDGFAMARGNPFQERILAFDAQQQHWERDAYQWASSSTPFAGIFIAFAAESPWTLRFDLEADRDLLPAFVLSGTGASFQHGVQTLVPVPGSGPVNQATFEAEVLDEGWSHLEILRQRLQPDSVHSADLELPNGHSYSGIETMHGYYVPFGPGSAGGYTVDYVGSLRDVAGTATAQVTYAEASLSVEFGYAHIPIGPSDLPGLGTADYLGSTWPFQGPELPDPP